MKKGAYFPGLNGLRFMAALFVFLHHVEQHKFWLNIPNLWGVALIDNIGHQARIIFFVLSGFLITYLFLKEKRKTGKINWWKFQTRRALRLWPVYYLMVIISIFVLPHLINIGNFNSLLEQNFWKQFAIYMLLFPNIARLLPPVMGANQFWSVGVQEQFYWLWPLVVRYFSKWLVPFLVIFIGAKVGIEILLVQFVDGQMVGTEMHTTAMQILKMWQLLLFEQMAVGALGAYWVFHEKQRILEIIFNWKTLTIAAVVFVATLFTHTHFVGYTSFQGAIALILILNISLNDKFPITLENKVLNYLGNLSFGMYAYHTAIIAIVVSVLTNNTSLASEQPVVFNLLLYVGTFGLTLLVSALSYKYLEGYFLDIKKKFRIVKNTDKSEETNAKEENLAKA